MVIGSILYLLEHYLLDTYQMPYTDNIALVILSTNIREAQSFFQASIPWNSLWIHFVSLCLITLHSWVIDYFNLPHYIIRQTRKTRGTLILYSTTGLLIGIWVATQFSLVNCTRNHYRHYMITTPVDRVVYTTYYCIRQQQLARENLSQLQKAESGEVSIGTLDKPHNLIIIMGESLRRRDMHCYGYPLPNTPCIDSMQRSGDLVLFDDVVSCKMNTAASLSEVLTYHTNFNEQEPWHKFPTLFSIFSKAGYTSFWLSNQEKEGGWVQAISAISQTADSVHYTSIRSSLNWWKKDQLYDELVLPLLSSVGQQSIRSSKHSLLSIIHLMGSHVVFTDRYPSSFNRFTIEDINEPLSMEQKARSAEYMNSIYYNDYIVGRIMHHYAATPSIVLYLSDHGLARYDDPSRLEFVGHSQSVPGVEVPFMIYLSPSFQALYPDIVQKIRRAAQRPFMTDLLPIALEGLTGVRSRFYTSREDLFSDDYDTSRPRVINSTTPSLTIPPKKRS